MNRETIIEVHADWLGLGGPQLLGHLQAVPGRGVERFAFTFAASWLRRDDRPTIDPALAPFGGPTKQVGKGGPPFPELAEFIERHGASPAADLEQLWRRIVFAVCVSTVDDHLRNHGFVLGAKGWQLSPAFDLNPVADGNGLRLDISETDNAQDLDLVREVAPLFRIKPARARAIIEQVVTAVAAWPAVAERFGVGRSEQGRMARAFRLATPV